MTPRALPGLQELAEENGWQASVVTRSGLKNDKPCELTVLRLNRGQANLAACWHDGRWDAALSQDPMRKFNQGQLKLVLTGEEVLRTSLPNIEDDVKENIRWERELCDAFISGHPLDYLDPRDRESANTTVEFSEGLDGQWFTLVGLISDVVVRPTRNGSVWARFSVEDSVGVAPAVSFGEIAKGAAEGVIARVSGPAVLRDAALEIKVTKAQILSEW